MGRMVCQLGGSLKYRVHTRPVDMRKSFRGLAGIVHSEIVASSVRKTCMCSLERTAGPNIAQNDIEKSEYNTNVEGV